MFNLSILKNYKFFGISIFLIEYLYLTVKLYALRVSLVSKSEMVIDSYYLYISNLILVLIKHSPFRFNKLSDIVVYDRPQFGLRFVTSYVLGNLRKDLKVRVRFSLKSKYTIVPSISTIIYSSNWAEREAMDMFGLKYIGHFDLRRILGDYGFWGFPGRKDFPLMGIYSYFYVINFLRVFRVRGVLNDFWSNYFQKKITN